MHQGIRNYEQLSTFSTETLKEFSDFISNPVAKFSTSISIIESGKGYVMFLFLGKNYILECTIDSYNKKNVYNTYGLNNSILSTREEPRKIENIQITETESFGRQIYSTKYSQQTYQRGFALKEFIPIFFDELFNAEEEFYFIRKER